MEKEKLTFLIGETKDEVFGRLAHLLLPCGHEVVIREQNGNDDDILSSFLNNDLDTGPINRFISSIIKKHNFEFTKIPNGISEEEVLNIPLRSKYFILMASRVFSLGGTLVFQWDWKNSMPPVEYEEDLMQYLVNYSNDSIKDFPKAIKPYTIENGNFERLLILKSGKKIKYHFLDGNGENLLLSLPQEKKNINSFLRARDLSLYNPSSDSWVPVVNFSFFSPNDMAEIRKDINLYDDQFEGLTEITNPNWNPNSGQPASLKIPFLSIPDFFYPREIL